MVRRAVFALEGYMFSGACLAAQSVGHPWIAWLVAAPAVAAIFGFVSPDRLRAVRGLEAGLHFLAALIGAGLIGLLGTVIIR